MPLLWKSGLVRVVVNPLFPFRTKKKTTRRLQNRWSLNRARMGFWDLGIFQAFKAMIGCTGVKGLVLIHYPVRQPVSVAAH